MSDVIHTPVTGQPVQQGWVMAYTDKLGNTKTLAPQVSRVPGTAEYAVLGPLPTLPNASGLRTRFDDVQYYST